jgi:uncharacterized membrane protein (DUF373 family)
MTTLLVLGIVIGILLFIVILVDIGVFAKLGAKINWRPLTRLAVMSVMTLAITLLLLVELYRGTYR